MKHVLGTRQVQHFQQPCLEQHLKKKKKKNNSKCASHVYEITSASETTEGLQGVGGWRWALLDIVVVDCNEPIDTPFVCVLGGYQIDFLLLLVDTCMLLEGADTRYFTVYAALGY